MTAALGERIRDRLARRDQGEARGDWAGGQVLAAAAMPARLVSAAVLIPIVLHADGPATVLLTRRSAHLKRHAGQVSFPGGVTGAGEAPLDAALREAREEIGLDPGAVEILGRLDDYVTTTAYRVVPLVGLLRAPLALSPQPEEVDEIFEVPLAFLLDPRNRERHARVAPDGTRREFYAIPYGAHYIWGATAAMLVNLGEVLGQVE